VKLEADESVVDAEDSDEEIYVEDDDGGDGAEGGEAGDGLHHRKNPLEERKKKLGTLFGMIPWGTIYSQCNILIYLCGRSLARLSGPSRGPSAFRPSIFLSHNRHSTNAALDSFLFQNIDFV